MNRTLVVAGFVLGSCNQAPDPRSPSGEYEIYAAALDAFSRVESPLRIASETAALPLVTRVGDTSGIYLGMQRDTGVGPDLLRSYDRANRESVRLCNCFPKRFYVELVPYTRRADVAGPIELSNIAFNTDRSRALVEVSQVCGRRCSGSALYLVIHGRDGWRVSRRILSGAS
jgi:hypothetical protein